jgi:hypothetical protein
LKVRTTRQQARFPAIALDLASENGDDAAVSYRCIADFVSRAHARGNIRKERKLRLGQEWHGAVLREKRQLAGAMFQV